jgi:hypothetical protein
MTIDINITFDESQIQRLLKIPILMRLKPAENVLKAMAKPVIDRAKSIAPSSRRSGTRKKWSRKYKDNPAYQEDSGRHIGRKFIRTGSGGLVIIGGIYPRANKQNYEAGDKRKIVYWGKKTSKIKRINPKERFMQKAFDETRTQQVTAGNEQLEKEIKELGNG